MQRGYKSKLEAGGVDAGQPIHIWTSVAGNSQYDIACFALDERELVPDDRYVVFFNQMDSPKGEISLVDGGANGTTFQVNLVSLPPQIQKLCFTVTIDGPGLMRDIKSGAVHLMQNGQTAFCMEFAGNIFQSQKAIVTIEIYNKGGWRVAAVANGFNFSGGLDELMAYFGVDVSGSGEIPPRQEKQADPPAGSPIREPPPSPPVVDNGPASGKNAEGFNRNDDDWV
jgi:stress response protein SCP2